jgi:predicted Zn finger-like uncharacterized protein
MLFTRCPDCDTTFRITDEALQKAGGRVRCGRCAGVFNAYAELQDTDDEATGETPAPAQPDGAAGGDEAVPQGVTPLAHTQAHGQPAAAPPSEDGASPTVADVVAEIELATDTESLEPELGPGDDSMGAGSVDEALTSAAPPSDASATWSGLAVVQQPARRWRVAAAVAAVALALQIGNHYRTSLAGNPALGPLVQRAYALLGVTVTPSWDVRQYKILDWVATAEPNTRGLGSLKISARIQNLGPLSQPYPEVKLRLKDRFEDAVGGRMFTPDEYLSSDARGDRLMQPGETARAAIEVVDPGPDAYGFELDVCIETEPGALSCGSDKVFL